MVNKYTYIEMYLDDLNKMVNLNEFEKHFKRHHQTVKRHLHSLVKEGILREEEKGRFRFYRLNKDNRVLYEYLSICEKQRLITFLENPLFRRLYNLLAETFKDNKILMFGSAINSKNYEDLDLLIISNNKKIRKILDEFEKTYSARLHIIQTSEKNLTKAFLNEIIQKHIIFNEHDYFLRLMYEN